MNDEPGPAIEADLARLRQQVAALTDFVTTVSAAMVADRALAASIVQALMAEGDSVLKQDECRWAHSRDVSVATIARDVLALAGEIPMPRPVRLIHSVGDDDYGPNT